MQLGALWFWLTVLKYYNYELRWGNWCCWFALPITEFSFFRSRLLLTIVSYSTSPSDPSPQLKLLCGADFLDTFKIPDLWKDDHVEEVAGRFGLVCISRGRLQPEQAVQESDLLFRHRQNIFHVREWVRNETSATQVRRALRRGLSVKYLIPDSVIEYIHQHNLYTENSEKKNEDKVLRPLTKQVWQPEPGWLMLLKDSHRWFSLVLYLR